MQKQGILGIPLKTWFVGLGGVFLLGVLWMIATHGFISISVTGVSQKKDISYGFYSQSSKTTSTTEQADSTLSKYLSSGTYQVTVSQDDARTIALASAGRFLTTESADVKLTQPLSVEFAGYDPRSCVFATAQVVTYECGGGPLYLHVAATSTQPTYAQKLESSAGEVYGIAKTKDGVVALSRTQGDDEGDGGTTYSLAVLDGNYNVARRLPLNGIDQNKDYHLQPFKDGFVVYDSGFESVQYFSGLSAAPQKIKISKPNDDKQKIAFVSASNGSMVAVYSDKAGVQPESNTTYIKKVKNTIVLYTGNQSESVSINKQVAAAELCGAQTLCALEAYTNRLYVYDISNGSDLLYVVDGVTGIATYGKQLYVSRDDGVVNFDVTTKSGQYIYVSGKNGMCGTTVNSSGILLCVTDNSGKSALLRLKPGTKSDSIEQKLSDLSRTNGVKGVSAYGRYIFVTPDFGEQVYVPELNEFDYNPVTKERVTREINSQINTLRIDRTKYSIIIIGG